MRLRPTSERSIGGRSPGQISLTGTRRRRPFASSSDGSREYPVGPNHDPQTSGNAALRFLTMCENSSRSFGSRSSKCAAGRTPAKSLFPLRDSSANVRGSLSAFDTVETKTRICHQVCRFHIFGGLEGVGGVSGRGGDPDHGLLKMKTVYRLVRRVAGRAMKAQAGHLWGAREGGPVESEGGVGARALVLAKDPGAARASL